MSMNGAESNNKTTIYVSDLPLETTQDFIHQIFRDYGNITQCELKPRKPGAKSIGAFVTFENHEQASKAIEECNYMRINDSVLRIQWQMINPYLHDNQSNLVIKDLPPKVEEASLNQHFRKYGEVLSCRIIKKFNGKNIGYVQFARVEDANRALDDLQNALIEGQPIYVDKFIPHEDRADIPVQLPHQAIHISHQDASFLTDDKIKQTFSKFGSILEVFNIENYVIAYFADTAGPAKIIQDGEITQKGYTVSVRVPNHITMRVRQIIDSRCVFLADLTTTNNQAIRDHLSKAGKLVTFEIQEKSPSQLLASAQYESEETRTKAIETLDRTTFEGQETPIRVLPYKARSLARQQPTAGLLMLDEIEYNTTYLDLRKKYSQYGEVITVSICPTPQATLVGFVLFMKYEDAQKAKAESKNAFLFPPVVSSQVLNCFYSAPKAKNNLLFAFNLPADKTQEVILTQFTQIGGSLNFIKTVQTETGRHALIQYRDDAGLIPAIKYLKEKNINYQIYTMNTLFKSSIMLYKVEMPNDYNGRFLFFNNLPENYSSGQIYNILTEKGFAVEAVNMAYNFETFEACTRASVLFKTVESAYSCFSNYTVLTEFPEITVQAFTNSALSSQQPIAQAVPQVQPMRRQEIKRPRQYLTDKTKERTDISDELKNKILEKIPKLSIIQVNEFSHDENKWNEYIKTI